MKRGLIIALAILLPFTALVALGFSLLIEPSLSPNANANASPSPSPRPSPSPSPNPSPNPSAKQSPVLPTLVPPLPPEILAELRRKPYLFTVDHMVRQCFADVSDRYPGPQQITVMFTPNESGTFEQVAIKHSTWQDPQLDACILDSFEDARFDPGERGTRRQSHTFTFSPADAGH